MLFSLNLNTVKNILNVVKKYHESNFPCFSHSKKLLNIKIGPEMAKLWDFKIWGFYHDLTKVRFTIGSMMSRNLASIFIFFWCALGATHKPVLGRCCINI